MRKEEFLTQLRNRLSGLPQDEMEERLTFYSEMIDDRMEEGLSEEEAVAEIGNVDDLLPQIITEIPITKLIKERVVPKQRLKTWEIVLLVLGAPLWLSLLIAACAVVFSLHMALWAVIFALWATFVALIAGVLACLVTSIRTLFGGYGLPSVAVIGIGMVCAGLSILLFFGCKAATKGAVLLTKKMALGMKHCLIKKEDYYE